jgi:dUTP pyrophosphatase
MNNKIIFERLTEGAIIPQRANPNDSGMDFFSPIDFAIAPKSDFLLPLGLKVKLPVGMDLVFENKSGRSTKNKLVRGACVVDEGYRGEVHAHLFNLGRKKVVIKAGEKIIQGIIRRVEFPEIVEGMITDITSRGAGGFGSSGITMRNESAQNNVTRNQYDDLIFRKEEHLANQERILIEEQTVNQEQILIEEQVELNDDSDKKKIFELEATISKLESTINSLVLKNNEENQTVVKVVSETKEIMDYLETSDPVITQSSIQNNFGIKVI